MSHDGNSHWFLVAPHATTHEPTQEECKSTSVLHSLSQESRRQEAVDVTKLLNLKGLNQPVNHCYCPLVQNHWVVIALKTIG
ncbi:UNVERIFIED_CONTAM: hypothetical protein FKN15_032331 [Acipenser sinensis]